MEDLGFVPDSSPSFSGAGATGDTDIVPHGTSLGFVPDDHETVNQEKYGTTGQQIIAGLEGAAKGFAGPAATYVETHLLGQDPEDIKGREEANPWTHGLSEAAGFGVGALTGTGEAALLGKVGEVAAHAAGLGETISTGSKLAKGAVTAATEMGLFQAGDELSKAMLNAPQTPGSIVANIGLSALLGGVTGPAFTGLGLAATKALDNTAVKEFMDRLSFRRANIDPHEMMRSEAESAVNTFNQMNSEITGAQGLKAQAIEKLLPESLTVNISKQVQDLSTKSQEAFQKMAKDGVPARYITKFENDANRFLEVVTSPEATTAQHYDALNDFKKTLQDYSKGNWGPFAVPRYHEAYDFLNITKDLSREVRQSLEDSKVWGKAADLQKELNKSWVKALPAAKDFEKKFMTKIGDESVISADKFNTYARQGLKSTTTTDRQKMLGNFIDAMDNHFNTVDKIYKAAGVENPFQPVGMSMLKESIEKPSLGSKIADIYHDKVSANALGNTAGSLIGGSMGHSIGHGLEGVYLGREILGPAFSNMIKPILEKYPNVDIGGLQQALSVIKNIQKGNTNLSNAARGVLEGSKTFPSHIIPSTHDLEKLDEKTKTMGDDVAGLTKIPGNVGYYLPGHETEIAKTAGDAITFINSKRPMPTKALPLDSESKVSSSEKSAFKRTLAIAQQPLIAMKHIKDGTLIPDDVKTIQTLYPEYYNKMSEQLMTALTNHLNENKTVPYKTKQSMSLFLGTTLDSTMTPMAIQDVQNVYAQKNQSMQAQQTPKKNTSKMNKISDSYLTANEASIKRRNNV